MLETKICPNSRSGCPGELVVMKTPPEIVTLLPLEIIDFLAEESYNPLSEKPPDCKDLLLAVCPECGYCLTTEKEDYITLTVPTSGGKD